MAASSPSLSSNGLSSTPTPPKTLRGLNKPKCIQCGNVARSRCPFQSCKGCCSRAENPCPIHVLKAAAGSGEKSQAQSISTSDHKLSEGTSGSTTRLASIRQLSSNFSQFNNLNVSGRSRKPLTIKSAIAINEWRFSKLKEFRGRNIEAENECFDRYMKNVNLLEDVLSVTENSDKINEQSNESIVRKMKVMLRSDPERRERFRDRIREIVNDGLAELQKPEVDEDEENERSGKRAKWEERDSTVSKIIEKLNKARNEEDLRSCKEMKSKVYHGRRPNDDDDDEKDKGLPCFVRRINVDEESLRRIDDEFSSLQQIEGL